MSNISIGVTGVIQSVQNFGVENGFKTTQLESQLELPILRRIIPQVLQLSHLLVASSETILEVQHLQSVFTDFNAEIYGVLLCWNWSAVAVVQLFCQRGFDNKCACVVQFVAVVQLLWLC